jgi:hypothetical protein
VKALLAKGADINAIDRHHGATGLVYAAHNGHTDTVQVLLTKGADFSVKDTFGETALMHAKKMGHKEIVHILKEAGAEPYLAKANEELYGTWVNMEYPKGRGTACKSFTCFQKIIWKPDGTVQRFVWADDIETDRAGPYKITDKWADSERDIWYKVLYSDWNGESYFLFKIGNHGKKYESVNDATEYPAKIDPKSWSYRVYYRK